MTNSCVVGDLGKIWENCWRTKQNQKKVGRKEKKIFFDCPYTLWLKASGVQQLWGYRPSACRVPDWILFPPLVAAVLITIKGAESPGSGRIGVIGALVFFSI